MNDEEIVELVNWKADFQEHSSELSPLDEEETQAVLRLPRKECRCSWHSVFVWEKLTSRQI